MNMDSVELKNLWIVIFFSVKCMLIANDMNRDFPQTDEDI